MGDELLSLLETELGIIRSWEEEFPGVYYLSVQPNGLTNHCSEYYIATGKAVLPQDALALGKALGDTSCQLYAIDPPEEGAWAAVLYELCKYRLTHSLLAPDGWSLTSAAAEGMELCPAYFGAFPVPPQTPWGWTLRHRVLDNGIYWIETSQGKTVLAVCHPIWTSELSEGTIKAGKTLAGGKPGDDEESLAYLFFDETASCTVIFELLKARPEWLQNGSIRNPELMNAIWKHQPLYAAAYNAQEQAGLHDGLGILRKLLGEDSDPHGSSENMISLNPAAGTNFIT